MGISVTSLVGSPLILATKKAKAAHPGEAQDTLQLLQQQGARNPAADGQVIVKDHPEDSQWSDLLKGEETGNGAYLDLAKVQMLYFTLILLLAYAVALGKLFAGVSTPIFDFPALSASFVALLGISHPASHPRATPRC